MAKAKRSTKRTPRKRTAPRKRAAAPAPVLEPQTPVVPPAAHPEPQIRSIWYIIGLVLLSMGAIIFAAGIATVGNPGRTVLANTYPSLWWGGIMMLFGAVFVFTHRKSVGH